MNTQQINDAVVSLLTANPWIILLVIWTIVWKIVAMWKAAKNNHLTFFIVVFFLNLAGIPEMIYLGYLYRKEKMGKIKK